MHGWIRSNCHDGVCTFVLLVDNPPHLIDPITRATTRQPPSLVRTLWIHRQRNVSIQASLQAGLPLECGEPHSAVGPKRLVAPPLPRNNGISNTQVQQIGETGFLGRKSRFRFCSFPCLVNINQVQVPSPYPDVAQALGIYFSRPISRFLFISSFVFSPSSYTHSLSPPDPSLVKDW